MQQIVEIIGHIEEREPSLDDALPNLFWQNSGRPHSKFKLEPTTGYCATCGETITQGVPNETLAGPWHLHLTPKPKKL